MIGLFAALSGGWIDEVLLRLTDILLAFPQIFLPLIAMATVGPKAWLIVLTVALTTMPRTVRVMRGAAASVVEREFISAARSIGDSRARIVRVEILPNVVGTLAVETTFRLTYAIQLIAALAFLGLSTSAERAELGHDGLAERNRTDAAAVGGAGPGNRDRVVDRGHGTDRRRARSRRGRMDRGADGGASRGGPIAVCGSTRGTLERADIVDLISLSIAPGRCSDWSASRARARPRSVSRCSATSGAARVSRAAGSRSGSSRCWLFRRGSCAQRGDA